jgi:predicted amidohydrolase
MKQSSSKNKMLKVAALQFLVRVADKASNINKMVAFIDKAIALGADILVLPELANTGYVFESRQEASLCAESIPEGPTTSMLVQKAKRRKIYICAGILEKAGKALFNSSILVGPEGFIGKYRKLHLWNKGKLLWESGNLGLPVFNLPFGRVGMLICYDLWFPETVRILKLQGADLILNPTNWDVDPEIITKDNMISPQVISIMAHVNSIFIISADICGYQRQTFFHGMSQISGPKGAIVKGSINEEEVITSIINIEDARKTRWTKYNDILKDRRTDVYADMLGYTLSIKSNET